VTLVVIPAFDESATVGAVVAGIRGLGLEAVVVDDGSEDDTATVARAAGATVLRLPVNVGVGGALRTGFRHARRRGARRVVIVDADLQHAPDQIPRLLAAADQGYDLVIGSRFVEPGYEVSALRRRAMRILSRVVSRRTGVVLTDVTSGFRVVSGPLLEVFADEYPAEYLSDTVEAVLLAHRNGARIAEVAVTMAPRAGGRPTSTLRAFGHFVRILLALVVKPRRRLSS